MSAVSLREPRQSVVKLARASPAREIREPFLCRQMLPALVSPSLQDLPSGVGCHALSEAVNFASLSLFGLIGTFHFFFLRLIFLMTTQHGL